MVSNEKILIAKTLKKIQPYFEDKYFCRCHKSYLINMQYFKELKKGRTERLAILMNNICIPVSQRKLITFKKDLKKYILSFN